MKKIIALLILLPGFMISTLYAQITAPGVKWNETYTFTINELKVDFIQEEWVIKLNYKSYYQTNSKRFCSQDDCQIKSNNNENSIWFKKEVANQIFGRRSDV